MFSLGMKPTALLVSERPEWPSPPPAPGRSEQSRLEGTFPVPQARGREACIEAVCVCVWFSKRHSILLSCVAITGTSPARLHRCTGKGEGGGPQSREKAPREASRALASPSRGRAPAPSPQASGPPHCRAGSSARVHAWSVRAGDAAASGCPRGVGGPGPAGQGSHAFCPGIGEGSRCWCFTSSWTGSLTPNSRCRRLPW